MISDTLLVGISPDFQINCSLGQRLNYLNVEVKRSKVQVTVRPKMDRKGTCGILKVMGSKLTITDSLSGEGVPIDGSLSRTV